MLERQSEFPGVEPEREFLREYPHGPVGAHLFGQVGEVNEKQLKDQRYNGVELGDRVGQAGIEAEYDRFLRGTQRRRARGGGRARQPHEDAEAAGDRAGRASCACRSTSTCSAWPSRRSPAAPARAPSP